jgi:hypothetical protein
MQGVSFLDVDQDGLGSVLKRARGPLHKIADCFPSLAGTEILGKRRREKIAHLRSRNQLKGLGKVARIFRDSRPGGIKGPYVEDPEGLREGLKGHR